LFLDLLDESLVEMGNVVYVEQNAVELDNRPLKFLLDLVDLGQVEL